MVPLKYQKFYFNHFDGLISDFSNKIYQNTSKVIANKDKIETEELIKSIRFAIRSLECLLAHYNGDGKKISILNALFDSLDGYKQIVPQKYHKFYFRHFYYLKNEFDKKRSPKKTDIIKKKSSQIRKRKNVKKNVRESKYTVTGTFVNSPSQFNKGNRKAKPVRDSEWKSNRDYNYFKKTTMEKTVDPFLANRLRRI